MENYINENDFRIALKDLNIGSLTRVLNLIDSIPKTTLNENHTCETCRKFRDMDNCAMAYRCSCGEEDYWNDKDDFCSRWKPKNKEQ